MDFKLDTKPTYTVITPVVAVLDAALTDALRQKWDGFAEKGSRNFIVDFHHCLQADEDSLEALAELHEHVYSQQSSLVFTNIQPAVLDVLKEKEIDQVINVAPTMIEAIDIVSMEILERDLFSEEDS
jgi:anti-anti-sigma regulatory factor